MDPPAPGATSASGGRAGHGVSGKRVAAQEASRPPLHFGDGERNHRHSRALRLLHPHRPVGLPSPAPLGFGASSALEPGAHAAAGPQRRGHGLHEKAAELAACWGSPLSDDAIHAVIQRHGVRAGWREPPTPEPPPIRAGFPPGDHARWLDGARTRRPVGSAPAGGDQGARGLA